MNLTVEATSPSDPRVSRWLLRRFSLRGAALGLPEDLELPDVTAVKGLAVIVRREDDGRELGTVLFEQVAPFEAQVHVAMTTFGSRTDHAFKLAVLAAHRAGYRRFYYCIASSNRAALALGRRLNLLSAAQEMSIAGVPDRLIVGEFETNLP